MHHKCGYSEESGSYLVEVIASHCENGEECVRSCPYSWKKNDRKKVQRADKAFGCFCNGLDD